MNQGKSEGQGGEVRAVATGGRDEGGGDARTTGIIILATFAVIAALYFGREFFTPVAFAFLLNALFRPVVRGLKRLGLPVPAGAAVVALGLIGLLVAAGFAVTGPVKRWVAEAPARFDAAEEKLARLRAPVSRVTAVANRIENVATAGGGGATQPSTQPAGPAAEGTSDAATTPEAPALPQAPAPAAPGLLGRFLGTTTTLVGGITEVLVLLYLLLASGDLFFRKLIKVMPTFPDKKAAAEVVEEAQSVVLRYFLVTLLINLGQATVVTVALWWMGMPSPVMWGLLTVVLEFIPYLGAAIMVTLLSVIAFATYDTIGRVLMVPGSYLLITTLQNNIVSPLAYGDRLKLNAVAVLLGVIFWWYVWGTPGAFLAVPLIATIKIVACRTERFAAVGEFLGE